MRISREGCRKHSGTVRKQTVQIQGCDSSVKKQNKNHIGNRDRQTGYCVNRAEKNGKAERQAEKEKRRDTGKI